MFIRDLPEVALQGKRWKCRMCKAAVRYLPHAAKV